MVGKAGRDETFLPKRAQIFVCSEHFTRDCFEVEHHYSLLGGTTRKRKKSLTLLLQFLKSLGQRPR